ncbi:MAG: RICIN domain-containing protein [Pseudonocardiaceae bacterium]
MTRTTDTTRGILAVLAVLGSLIFAIALPVAANAAPLTTGAAATDVIPCPLTATPPVTGPVPTCPPPCPPPCPPLPTPQSSGAIVCPLPAAPATSDANVIIKPCTVSAFQNLGTTFCLDSPDSAVRNVLTAACDGARSQQWVFDRSNTTSTIRDLATGLCLTSDVTGNVFAVSCLSPTPTSAPGRWFITQSGGPVIDVVTGRCLDSPLVPGSAIVPVDTRQCNGTAVQNWLHR